VLVVDEAQDLMLGTYLDVLDVLLARGLRDGKWRVFLDPKQNVFSGMQQGMHERLKQGYPALATLRWNCRNTRPIAINAALLSGTVADNVARAEGPEVELYWYRDNSHQHRLLSNFLNRVCSEGVPPEQVVVLSPNKRTGSVIANGLDSARKVTDITEDGVVVPGSIGFSTIAGFKGLEADVVALVDIRQLSSPESSALIYVGASRPRVLLAAFLQENTRAEFEERSREFGIRLGT
jgi:superfamily I DNA/RNA helicase